MEDNSFPNADLSNMHQSLCTGISDVEFPQLFVNDPSEMLVQATDHHTPGNPIIQTEPTNWYACSPLLWHQLNANFSAGMSESDISLFSSLLADNATPRTAWCKLRAAVIWRILIGQMRVMKAKKAVPRHVP